MIGPAQLVKLVSIRPDEIEEPPGEFARGVQIVFRPPDQFFVPFSAEDVASAAFVLARYRELEIGLADASIVVLAQRYGVLDVLTLDHRHFHALRGPGGRRFHLRPAS